MVAEPHCIANGTNLEDTILRFSTSTSTSVTSSVPSANAFKGKRDGAKAYYASQQDRDIAHGVNVPTANVHHSVC